MDRTKRCCATCADDECRTRAILNMNGAYLQPDYCMGNGYSLWKPENASGSGHGPSRAPAPTKRKEKQE